MRNPICNLCNRCKTARTICLYPNSNNQHRDIMIIIDNVSQAQDQTGMLMSGQGGNVLVKLLDGAGITHRCYVTAAVKCFGNNIKPTAKDVRVCRKYLLEEIEEVNPKLIICLGSIASKAIFDKPYPLKELRQRFFTFPSGAQVTATFSHNVIFTDPSKFSTLQKDLQWILNNFNRTQSEFEYTFKVEEPISESNIYGIDIESTGLNVYTDKLLTLAIANPIDKISIGYNIGHNKCMKIN